MLSLSTAGYELPSVLYANADSSNHCQAVANIARTR